MIFNKIGKDDSHIQVVVSVLDLKEFLLEIMEKYSNPNPPREEETYLTTVQVKEMLHCTATTLWRWNKIGYLCFTKVGSKRCYKLSDVKRIMEGKR